jgi:hypothetical protein
MKLKELLYESPVAFMVAWFVVVVTLCTGLKALGVPVPCWW